MNLAILPYVVAAVLMWMYLLSALAERYISDKPKGAHNLKSTGFQLEAILFRTAKIGAAPPTSLEVTHTKRFTKEC